MNPPNLVASGNDIPENRLSELGIVLPKPPAPVGNFVTHVIEGRKLYLSGQGPLEPNGNLHRGKVGKEVSAQEAYEHSRLAGINLLSVMKDALGDLSRVRRIVKIFGMVNAIPEFEEHPFVINGCSDLFVQVFGSAGQHARSAVGFGSLPRNITVEIEAIVAF